jgi:hypothetical protein
MTFYSLTQGGRATTTHQDPPPLPNKKMLQHLGHALPVSVIRIPGPATANRSDGYMEVIKEEGHALTF